MRYKHLVVGVLLGTGLACDAPGPALGDSAQAAVDSSMVYVQQARPAMYDPPPKGFAPIDFPGVAMPLQPALPSENGVTLKHRRIRTASATVEVDSLARAVARARAITRALGGYLAGSSQHADRGHHVSGAFVLRVPAAALDDLMDSIKTLGLVEAAAVSITDVGEETVDVAVRVENARWLERRLRTLIATRTAKLKDVLAAERELASVRSEIETLEARQRYLDNHVAMSTLTLSLHEPWPPAERQAAVGPLARAVGQAWRNFTAVIAFGIAALGVIVPLGIVGSVGWLVWRRQEAALSSRDA